MRKIIDILLAALVALLMASCSPAEIRQAKVMTQGEIDAYNSQFGGGGETPDNPENPDNPDNPENPDNPDNPDDPPTPPVVITTYYVSVSGAGNKTGENEENALDLTAFKNVVVTPEASGKPFRFASGTYELGNLQLESASDITFEGGPDAILSGASTTRILSLGGGVNLTIKGLTLANGFSTNHGGAIYANNCSLTLDACTVMNNKTSGSGDKNGNNGAGIYLDKNMKAASFKNCVFSGNNLETTATDQYGGAIRIESQSEPLEISIENCTFKNNFAKQASCISVNAKVILKVKDCLFEENSAKSRGMIQVAQTVVFMDGCTFHANTTTDNNGWGVDFHGKGYLCLNDCTIYGNSNTQMGTNNNVALNGYHSLLMTDCTVIEACQLGLLRIDDAAGKQVLCGNILVNTTGKTVLIGNTSATTVSMGHNAMSAVIDYAPFTAHSTDVTGCTLESFGGASYYGGKFVWDGNLAGYTPATDADKKAAMAAFDVSLSGTMDDIGAKFSTWLGL